MMQPHKVIRCECGVEARSGEAAVLLVRAQRHAREAHAMGLTADQLLPMAEDADVRGGAPRARRAQPRSAVPNLGPDTDASRGEGT